MGERWRLPPEDYRRALPLLRRVGALSAERGQPDRRRSSATEPTGRPPEPTTPPPPTAPADFRRCAENGTIVPFFREKPGFFWEKCCTKVLFGAVVACYMVVSVCTTKNAAATVRVSGERNGCRCCIFKNRERSDPPPPAGAPKSRRPGRAAERRQQGAEQNRAPLPPRRRSSREPERRPGGAEGGAIRCPICA